MNFIKIFCLYITHLETHSPYSLLKKIVYITKSINGEIYLLYTVKIFFNTSLVSNI